MGKQVNVTIYIDQDVVKEARELGLNISKTCENALKEAIRRLKGEESRKNPNSSSLRDCGVLRAGFEPASPARKAPESRNQSFLQNKLENGRIKRIIGEFADFCRIDLQLKERTVESHISKIKRFLEFLKKEPVFACAEDIRKFLLSLKDKSSYTYANFLKALKVFFRDYLGMPHVVATFKFPHHEITPKRLPTKVEMREFYEALPNLKSKTLFLLYASSGLRLSEVLDLKLSDIDLEKRMIFVNHNSRTKRGWVSFFNKEAEKLLKKYIKTYKPKEKLFRTGKYRRSLTGFIKAKRETGMEITPQILREWFCSEMGRLGVPDRYVDAFCGRVPRTVLARHYTDFSPEKLKEIYDKVGIRILN